MHIRPPSREMVRSLKHSDEAILPDNIPTMEYTNPARRYMTMKFMVASLGGYNLGFRVPMWSIEEKRALNMPPRALLAPRKGGIATSIAGMAIMVSSLVPRVSPAKVPRIPQTMSMGKLSLIIRLITSSRDLRPIAVLITAMEMKRSDSTLTGDGDITGLRLHGGSNFNSTRVARNNEGMVTISPVEVIIGDDTLSRSQFLR